MAGSQEKETGVLERLAPLRETIERRLEEILPLETETHPGLSRAMAHALLGPGKRIRPLLCLLTYRSFHGTNERAALDVAASLELIHTYSLVHDDLPCMDNDTLRRGRPTCHVVYGEAMAVLAGDALFTLAFGVMGGLPALGVPGETATVLVGRIGEAAGPGGLISGQAWDLDESVDKHDPERLESIHRQKTGSLLGVSLEAGAILAGTVGADLERIARAGNDLGLAFQIIDDVLDETGTPEELGKTPGKDRIQDKATYPSLLGLEKARGKAEEIIASVLRTLGPLGADPDLLDLITLIGCRSS